jgi:hypothetical protein
MREIQVSLRISDGHSLATMVTDGYPMSDGYLVAFRFRLATRYPLLNMHMGGTVSEALGQAAQDIRFNDPGIARRGRSQLHG